MAEAFGLAASIFATVQIADRVVTLCKHYIESVRDAPSDLRVILLETSLVKAALQQVEFLVKCEQGDSSLLSSLDGASGPVKGCHDAITELLGLLPPSQVQTQGEPTSKRRRVEASLTTLAWPLKQTKAKKLLEDIARHKNNIIFTLTTDSIHDIKKIKENTSQIQQILTESQRNEVNKWLNHTDPSSLHHQACKNQEPGTCDWVSRLTQWTDFMDEKIRCLWIHGIPGAGKTVLASHLIQDIQRHCQKTTTDISISINIYYYCYFVRNQDESAPFLKWILGRLCRKSDQIPDRLWKLFQYGEDPSVDSLLAALESALHHFDHVFITIDAVDESSPRDELLKVLRDLATDPRFAKIRLLATSREYLDIENVMQGISTEISMRNPHLDADIRLYTQSRLSNHNKIKNWPQALRDETLEALCGGAKGMFRWVVCQIDALRRVKGTNAAIRKELRNLPKTLDDAYDRIFQMIPDEDLIIVESALRWICFNDKVCRFKITCPVLLGAVENDVCRNGSLKREYLYDTELIRELCGCLITVETFEHEQKNGPLVRYQEVYFAHYTVLEYLASSRRCRPDRFFDLDKAELLVNQAEVILKGNQSFCLADVSDLKRQEGFGLENIRFTTFSTYRAFLALELVSNHDGFLSKRQDLASLVITPDPEDNHFLDVLQRSAAVISMKILRILYGVYARFVYMTWDALPLPQIRILVYLLKIGATHLAHLILQQNDAASLLQANLKGRTSLPSHPTKWHFSISLVDYFATYSMLTEKPFEFLIQNWAKDFDQKTVLASYVVWHSHNRDEKGSFACEDWCILQKLLHLGAQTDSPGSFITPLQIAVACLDLEGVAVLLKGGAAPNAPGNPAAENRSMNSRLHVFDSFCGMASLEICRTGPHSDLLKGTYRYRLRWEDIWHFRLENARDIATHIENVLLEHGAS